MSRRPNLDNSYKKTILPVKRPKKKEMVTPPKKSTKEKFWNYANKIAIVIGVAGAISLLLLGKSCYEEHDRHTRQSDTQSETLIPSPLVTTKNTIIFKLGYTFDGIDRDNFNNGESVALQNIGVDNFFADDLYLRIVNDRLLVSNTFTNYDGKPVGQLQDNKWLYYQSNDMKCGFDAQSFEVVDKQRNVIFSLSYRNADTVAIMGYKVVGNKVVVFNKDGMTIFDKKADDYNNVILPALQAIPKMFNY